jgi:hypothetical protein
MPRRKKNKPLNLIYDQHYLCGLCKAEFLGADYARHKRKCAPKLLHNKYGSVIKPISEIKTQTSTPTRTEMLTFYRNSVLNKPYTTEELKRDIKKSSLRYGLIVKK